MPLLSDQEYSSIAEDRAPSTAQSQPLHSTAQQRQRQRQQERQRQQRRTETVTKRRENNETVTDKQQHSKRTRQDKRTTDC